MTKEMTFSKSAASVTSEYEASSVGRPYPPASRSEGRHGRFTVSRESNTIPSGRFRLSDSEPLEEVADQNLPAHSALAPEKPNVSVGKKHRAKRTSIVSWSWCPSNRYEYVTSEGDINLCAYFEPAHAKFGRSYFKWTPGRAGDGKDKVICRSDEVGVFQDEVFRAICPPSLYNQTRRAFFIHMIIKAPLSVEMSGDLTAGVNDQSTGSTVSHSTEDTPRRLRILEELDCQVGTGIASLGEEVKFVCRYVRKQNRFHKEQLTISPEWVINRYSSDRVEKDGEIRIAVKGTAPLRTDKSLTEPDDITCNLNYEGQPSATCTRSISYTLSPKIEAPDSMWYGERHNVRCSEAHEGYNPSNFDAELFVNGVLSAEFSDEFDLIVDNIAENEMSLMLPENSKLKEVKIGCELKYRGLTGSEKIYIPVKRDRFLLEYSAGSIAAWTGIVCSIVFLGNSLRHCCSYRKTNEAGFLPSIGYGLVESVKDCGRVLRGIGRCMLMRKADSEEQQASSSAPKRNRSGRGVDKRKGSNTKRGTQAPKGKGAAKKSGAFFQRKKEAAPPTPLSYSEQFSNWWYSGEPSTSTAPKGKRVKESGKASAKGSRITKKNIGGGKSGKKNVAELSSSVSKKKGVKEAKGENTKIRKNMNKGAGGVKKGKKTGTDQQGVRETRKSNSKDSKNTKKSVGDANTNKSKSKKSVGTSNEDRTVNRGFFSKLQGGPRYDYDVVEMKEIQDKPSTSSRGLKSRNPEKEAGSSAKELGRLKGRGGAKKKDSNMKQAKDADASKKIGSHSSRRAKDVVIEIGDTGSKPDSQTVATGSSWWFGN